MLAHEYYAAVKAKNLIEQLDLVESNWQHHVLGQ